MKKYLVSLYCIVVYFTVEQQFVQANWQGNFIKKFVLIVSVIGDINFIYNHIQKLKSLSDCFKQFLLKMMPNYNCFKSFALVGEPMLILPAMQICTGQEKW